MNKKMVEGLIPSYLKRFKCIGGKCEDTCCSGWYISIDEDTYKKYKKIKNYKIKNKIEKNVVRIRTNKSFNNVAKMKLRDGKCAFLMENMLCEIHKELGEEYLSETCKIYPKYVNRINGVLEKSVTISCPEAARIVLLNKEKLEFENCMIEESKFKHSDFNTNEEKKEMKDYFWELRIFSIGLLQNEDYNIEEKLIILGMFYENLKEIKDVKRLINRYSRYIKSKILKDEIGKIKSQDKYKISLCKDLLKLNRKVGSENYEKILEKLVNGLKLNEEIEISINAYKKTYADIYIPFIEKNEYIIENYLVNYVFKSCFPFDENEVFESYIMFVIHYIIFKLHLIGCCAHRRGMDSKECVEVFQVVSRTFEHDKNYFKMIIEAIKENGYDKLANMVSLIKND
ncbi:MAG: flagellin lysine-N-methylase [Clostridium sp.]